MKILYTIMGFLLGVNTVLASNMFTSVVNSRSKRIYEIGCLFGSTSDTEKCRKASEMFEQTLKSAK